MAPACAVRRAGLPVKQQGGYGMDELQEFEDGEREDLIVAAGAMALHWKANGLDDQVRAIGQEQGIAGARVMLAAWLGLRAKRAEIEHAGTRDVIPF